jgi:hypothetical protein
MKPIYIAGKKRWPDQYGDYKLKLGSAIEVRIVYSKDTGHTKLDYRIEIDVLGENVLLDYRTTAEAAALLVTRKLRQILNSLKEIDNEARPEPKAKERGPRTNAVPNERGPHTSRRRALPA